MSEFFPNKRLITLVLIGNEKEDKRKTNLIVLLHVILSGTAFKQFASKKYSPPIPEKSGDLLRYRVEGDDGLVIDILDTPVLDANGAQAAKITNALSSLPRFDALMVMLDQTKPKLDSDVEHLLDQLIPLFPRSIHRNFVFLFACPEKDIGARDMELLNRPTWADKKQVVLKPIADVVKIRNEILDDPDSTEDELQDELKNPFNNSIARLKPLWEYINSCSVQTREIKELYLRATDIESQIYQILTDDPTLGDDKAANPITMLVNEYIAVSASPDFITHLELVIELLRTKPDHSGITAGVEKLEKARARLKAAENGGDKYPKWHVICEAF